MARRCAALAALGCAAMAALSACHRPAPTGDAAPASSGATIRTPPAPADHLAPGELLEGTDKALGVTLPRGLRIDGAFRDVVYTTGLLDVHALATYFAAHLQNGDFREGATSATFEHVTAKEQPGRLLSVHIMKTGGGARVDIRDETPLTGPQLPDEAARWKRVGLTPSGRLIDPTHLD
jgi:hypothetical protein